MSGDGFVDHQEYFTEIASLREIKAKLDMIIANQVTQAERQISIMDAQGKLYAAIDALQAKSVSDWNVFMGAIDGLNAGIAGEIDGLNAGVAREIGELRKEIENLHPVMVPLTCGDCGRDFDHCKCKVFAARNPFPAKPKRKRKRP